MLADIKDLRVARKFAAEKPKFRGSQARIYAPGLRGSRMFHDPKAPGLEVFADPDAKGVNRAAIGRYGDVGEFKPFPLMLLRAAHVVTQQVYYNPLDYSISRRVNTDGVPRRRYSQYRAALAKVVGTLIMHTSLEYGMVGKVRNGKFYHMSLKAIASHAGVGYESAKRVLRVLREKGAMKVGKQFKTLSDNQFEGHNSIRHLTRGFWEMFGFGKWMREEQKKRSAARRDQAEGKPATTETKLLNEKWEPKREKVMGVMQREAVMDIYLKNARDFLNC